MYNFNAIIANYSYQQLKSAEHTLRSSIQAHTKHGFGNPCIAARWLQNYRAVTDRMQQIGHIGAPPVNTLPNQTTPNTSYAR